MDDLKNLPGDPLAAHEFALRQMRELNAEGASRLQWLTALDMALRPASRELAAHYAGATRLPTEEEARLWHAGHEFHDQWAQAYSDCLHDDSVLAVADLPNLITRILHHRSRAAVWRYFRYIPLPSGWWLDTHRLYARAEAEGSADSQVMLYADEASSSCMAVYLQTLLLSTINLTNMTRQQIEEVDIWLRDKTWAVELEQDYLEDIQLFFVDLAEDRGGRRIRNFQPLPSYRYWRTDALTADIAQALESGDSRGILDHGLLKHMYAEWSRSEYKRQRRSEERNETSRKASVIHGIYAVCQEVQAQAAGGQRGHLDGELWHIESESRYGFGAVVSIELNMWLKVGRLIALREEVSLGMCVVGVVRNLKHHETGKIYAGCEILSHMALYGRLQYLQNDTPIGQVFPCVFLPTDERGFGSSLLLPLIEYEANAELMLRMEAQTRRIRLGKQLEQKDDWVRVEIDVLGS